jgi:hypothetical protein
MRESRCKRLLPQTTLHSDSEEEGSDTLQKFVPRGMILHKNLLRGYPTGLFMTHSTMSKSFGAFQSLLKDTY